MSGRVFGYCFRDPVLAYPPGLGEHTHNQPSGREGSSDADLQA